MYVADDVKHGPASAGVAGQDLELAKELSFQR